MLPDNRAAHCYHVIETRPAQKRLAHCLDFNGAMQPMLVCQYAAPSGLPVRAADTPDAIDTAAIGTHKTIDITTVGTPLHCSRSMHLWANIVPSAIDGFRTFQSPTLAVDRPFAKEVHKPVFLMILGLYNQGWRSGFAIGDSHTPDGPKRYLADDVHAKPQ